MGRPNGKIYEADAIESGTFAECMIEEVRNAFDYNSENERVEQFVIECEHYVGNRGSEIEPEVAQRLFDEFKSLIGEK